jgi:hypothetical protein
VEAGHLKSGFAKIGLIDFTPLGVIARVIEQPRRDAAAAPTIEKRRTGLTLEPIPGRFDALLKRHNKPAGERVASVGPEGSRIVVRRTIYVPGDQLCKRIRPLP